MITYCLFNPYKTLSLEYLYLDVMPAPRTSFLEAFFKMYMDCKKSPSEWLVDFGEMWALLLVSSLTYLVPYEQRPEGKAGGILWGSHSLASGDPVTEEIQCLESPVPGHPLQESVVYSQRADDL